MLSQSLNRLPIINSLILTLYFTLSSFTVVAENKKKGFCIEAHYYFCNVTPHKMYETMEELIEERLKMYKYYYSGISYEELDFQFPARECWKGVVKQVMVIKH